jgi:hypothetical protein
MNGKDENYLESGKKEWAKRAWISVSLEQTCVWFTVMKETKECDTVPQESKKLDHGFPTFYGNWPHPLLWAGSWGARGKITCGITAQIFV